MPDEVNADVLDDEVRRELKVLPPALTAQVTAHLVMAVEAFQEDLETAYAHATAAQRLAPRLACTREAAGVAAYATERYSEALAQFRAVRRLNGSVQYWPMMADCERGLGRPERALEMAKGDEVTKLDRAGQVEMRIVTAGARSDLGQLDAAVLALQGPELKATGVHPWTARLRYAYSEALLATGRAEEARQWLVRAVDVDPSGETGAADRLAELDGVEFTDALDPDVEDDEQPEEPTAATEPEETTAGTAETAPAPETSTD